MSLVVENLSKNFNHQSVIRNYNLTIGENEVVALVGRSGTGKTTFLRLINNLEVADQGSIQINEDFLVIDGAYVGKEGQRNYQKRMGMVFQNYELFPNLNVLAIWWRLRSLKNSPQKKHLKRKRWIYYLLWRLQIKTAMPNTPYLAAKPSG